MFTAIIIIVPSFLQQIVEQVCAELNLLLKIVPDVLIQEQGMPLAPVPQLL